MYFTHPQFKNFTLRPFFARFSETELKNRLSKLFPEFNFIFTDSGRSAFRIAIEGLNLRNSAMIVPAYLCDIFLPIFKKYNITPVYLDIDPKTFQSEVSKIQEKITPEVKSILVCHTYGLFVNLDRILEIAQKNKLKIIEDCAHLLPKQIQGDCAFLSFAKICPNINGGVLICKQPIKAELPEYRFGFSNIIKFLRLYPQMAHLSENFRKENFNQKELSYPHKASKLSLKLFNYYLKTHQEQLLQRIKLAKYFQNKLISLGFGVQIRENNTFTYLSALVPQNVNRDELFEKLRACGIFCSRIWKNPLYIELPNTQKAAQNIINFPLQNWYTEKDVDYIIEKVRSLIFNTNL